MQIFKKKFNPEKYTSYKALTLKQPYASSFVTASCKDENDNTFAERSIEVVNKNTDYRGDILICASRYPEIYGLENGCLLGFVELYDTKPVAEFTDEDWKRTRVPRKQWGKIKQGYGWFFRNPRKVVELPVFSKRGMYDVIMEKDDITLYPQILKVDKI